MHADNTGQRRAEELPGAERRRGPAGLKGSHRAESGRPIPKGGGGRTRGGGEFWGAGAGPLGGGERRGPGGSGGKPARLVLEFDGATGLGRAPHPPTHAARAGGEKHPRRMALSDRLIKVQHGSSSFSFFSCIKVSLNVTVDYTSHRSRQSPALRKRSPRFDYACSGQTLCQADRFSVAVWSWRNQESLKFYDLA